MVIGKFEKTDEGYQGVIATLALHCHVRFVKREKGANFAVYGPDEIEFGAAWFKDGEYGSYLSVKLDSPGFLVPINCVMPLKPTDEGAYLLRWQRRENGRDGQ